MSFCSRAVVVVVVALGCGIRLCGQGWWVAAQLLAPAGLGGDGCTDVGTWELYWGFF
ncbi:hypothetical protein P280DRAFT_469287 [Massarina eburnea CBS 473.64]|uniref:Uncharacterized protein n=1 Tax=Massarina eburnea CBS 473.64 TaxID=1395130 RepID=A0A6A6S0E4_9PLEO|nr:hypothetical protein P280DRAFT_469287 [Massarina eburnea CBS 473.64]